MPRPSTRADLLAAAVVEHDRLVATVHGLFGPEVLADIDWQADIDDQSRNPRDVWCHLHAWHELTHGWVTLGCAGGSPAIPGEGLTWRDLPVLNAGIWERYRGTPWDEAVALLQGSHARMLALIEAQPDTLFDKGVHAWTKSTSVGAYLVSATSSHSLWGVKTLKAIAKARAATLSAGDA